MYSPTRWNTRKIVHKRFRQKMVFFGCKKTHQRDKTQGNNSTQALSTKIVFFRSLLAFCTWFFFSSACVLLFPCVLSQGNNSTQVLSTKIVCFRCKPSCFLHLKHTIFVYYCFLVFRFVNFPRPALSNQLTPDIICHAEGPCRTDFLCVVWVCQKSLVVRCLWEVTSGSHPLLCMVTTPHAVQSVDMESDGHDVAID